MGAVNLQALSTNAHILNYFNIHEKKYTKETTDFTMSSSGAMFFMAHKLVTVIKTY